MPGSATKTVPASCSSAISSPLATSTWIVRVALTTVRTPPCAIAAGHGQAAKVRAAAMVQATVRESVTRTTDSVKGPASVTDARPLSDLPQEKAALSTSAFKPASVGSSGSDPTILVILQLRQLSRAQSVKVRRQ